jgi:hypothetical protein
MSDEKQGKERVEFVVDLVDGYKHSAGIIADHWPIEYRINNRYYHFTGIAYPEGMRPATDEERQCVPEGSFYYDRHKREWQQLTVGIGDKWDDDWEILAVPITPPKSEQRQALDSRIEALQSELDGLKAELEGME